MRYSSWTSKKDTSRIRITISGFFSPFLLFSDVVDSFTGFDYLERNITVLEKGKLNLENEKLT
jgi:hypothetical protein